MVLLPYLRGRRNYRVGHRGVTSQQSESAKDEPDLRDDEMDDGGEMRRDR
mgnify:FL=1|jgi:hypothetical protein